jgi:hypothetical protein
MHQGSEQESPAIVALETHLRRLSDTITLHPADHGAMVAQTVQYGRSDTKVMTDADADGDRRLQ